MRRLTAISFIVPLQLVGLAVPVAARELSFEERVEAQRAIERVYYSHQIGTAKPFEAAVPRELLERKVRTYLEQSAALEQLWNTPVTAEALEREWQRIAASSHFPERLREIYRALGDDPVTIQECLVRPALVDRLARTFFARDDRVHGEARREAEELRARLSSGELSGLAERAGRTVMEVVRASDSEPIGHREHAENEPRSVNVAETDFADWRARAPRAIGDVSELSDESDLFSISVLLEEQDDRFRIATYAIEKESWDGWWQRTRNDFSAVGVSVVAVPVEAPQGGPGCLATNSWSPTVTPHYLVPRRAHATVWTGSLMIVWGGIGHNDDFVGSGHRYDPLTDTWTPMSTVNAPAQGGAQGVWTSTEAIIWSSSASNSRRYDPISDTWTAISNVNAPSNGLVLWTGSEMIVWGTSAGRYSPGTDSWMPLSTVNAPQGRTEHTAVWTGTEMIVWGGRSSPGGTLLSTGGRYNPTNDTWTATTTTDAPSPRNLHAAVWTGSRMIVWGGLDPPVTTGSLYDPVADAWMPVGFGGPVVRSPRAVWTGNLMLVWGGNGPPAGSRYDPASDTWDYLSQLNAPGPVTGHSAVWTGSRMLIWGGRSGTPPFYVTDQGGRYDPVTDSWTPTSILGPSPRSGHSAVWTGNVMVVWGGTTSFFSPQMNSGGRYDPTLDTWTPTSMLGAPAPREGHGAVWSGSEIVVWGGTVSHLETSSGGRYDPSADSWQPTTLTGAPAARTSFSTVWTGSEMVVWGGLVSSVETNTGGRYNPATDSWRPTAAAGAPAARVDHVAAWAGNRMAIWGGRALGSPLLATGALYEPITNVWSSMSTVNAPSARYSASSVWTGQELLVWGGTFPYTNTGGRYDPASDTWQSMTVTGAPEARRLAGAVWTGSRMIVWGGRNNSGISLNTGGLYDPQLDTWTATSTTGAPAGRALHAAVWTGNEMIVWGGTSSNTSRNDGGLYSPDSDGDGLADCADNCPVAANAGQSDQDADGHGDACDACPNQPDGDSDGDGFFSCADCDDSDVRVHPGASEICDGKNNDCDDPAWPALPPYELDADGDSLAECQGDCDDAHAAVYAGAPQICDGVNNDCNHPSWPLLSGTNDGDDDSDAFTECQGDCDDTRSSVRPGGAQVCDGRNNDCNHPGWPGLAGTNEADDDADGFTECQNDCNDAAPAVRPGAIEVCNGIDDDCDNLSDEDQNGQDSDGDGVANLCDNCPQAVNPSQADNDGDLLGNSCDNCLLVSNPSQQDTDSDGRGDACDNCPTEAGASQDDTDGDGRGDICDNCIFDRNPGQSDSDDDFDGDVCDFDDGLILIYFNGPDFVEWQLESGFDTWNAYRGDLTVLRGTGTYTQAPGSNPLASRECGLTDPIAAEPDNSTVGQVAFWLVTGVSGGNESSLGTNSMGNPRPNANPCP